MASDEADLARAVTDGEDRLICAEEPLAGLQLQCGGELPGRIAIPSLLETVRKARRYQLKLGRNIQAHNADEAVDVWVEVAPRQDGDPGCDISFGGWRASPLPAEDDENVAIQREVVDRQVAEFSALLDSEQRTLVVENCAPDLCGLHEEMASALGRHWTDFVSIKGLSHRQPVHWRLLDGAMLSIAGSDRDWRVALLPKWAGETEPGGFELLLVAEQPLPLTPDENSSQPEASGAKSQMIGREIAPVLRQPIARIIANAETIRARLAGPLADDYAQYAADIANAGQLLLGLLGDLSDLEVVEAHDFATAPDRIDLATVVRQAAGILGVRANEKAITIDVPGHGDTLFATAEFRRVLQILMNVISNAIRYSPEDSQVWVRLEDAGEKARVIIADQGPGMTPEQALVIFEKFERLGRSDDGGSGLGLYISRRLARAMGGELSVDSAPGQGARLILDLPAAPAETD
ncbi:MAG: sensor histidine kinase [Sphingomonadaceae bacterium]|nr:sensor histidine kinase [Sphingomonadaceae bacterium]